MDIYAQVAKRIIEEQETIIGPLALEQAKKVPGLDIDWQKKVVNIKGNEKNVVEQLVEKYRDFFGNASVEVCRDAAKTLIPKIPKDELPPILLG